MPTPPAASPERKPLIVLCVIAALMLMYATLWPFNPYPHNDVSWLPDANGIRFGGTGIVWSKAALRPPLNSASQDSCAIEIFLFPATSDDSGNFLTFSSDDNPDAVFLRQWRESLLIYKSNPTSSSEPKLVDFEIDGALRVKRLVFVTVSSGEQGTTVYVDGRLAKSNPHFRIHPADLYRKIVLGTSPSNFQVWHGQIRGLAVHDHEISPEQAQAQFDGWSTGSFSPAAVAENIDHAIAIYDFSERSGPMIRSEKKSATSLTIPEHFSLPHKALLASPIDEFQWDASWRHDVIENIIGFMPFGFVLCGLFALSRPRGQAILMATLVGGLLSFTVESLQYYIPRRDSSLTDVISNTTGSLLGALIAHPELVRAALRLVFLVPSKRKSEANQI